MTVLTSISPTHVLGDVQNHAMRSWHENKVKVYSLNSQDEIDTLQPNYPFITFIPDTRCYENQKMHGKPYISIASFFDFGETLQDDHIAIVNSDIYLKYNKTIFNKIITAIDNRGFVIGKRYNFINSFEDGKIEGAGVDFFAIHRECLSCLPRTYEFVMGQCWWDYWFPTIAMNLQLQIYKIQYPFLYHKKHQLQWSQELWHKLSNLFVKDTGYNLGNRTPPQVSMIIHNNFYNRAIPITL